MQLQPLHSSIIATAAVVVVFWIDLGENEGNSYMVSKWFSWSFFWVVKGFFKPACLLALPSTQQMRSIVHIIKFHLPHDQSFVSSEGP
jgi:hypothetical protein